MRELPTHRPSPAGSSPASRGASARPSLRHSAAVLVCYIAGLSSLLGGRAAEPDGEDWKFDVVQLKNGKPFRGLLLEESPARIRLQCVLRKRGQPTFCVATTFRPDEVGRIDRLSPAERARLAERLSALDPSGKGEERRMDELALSPAAWNGKPGGGLEYTAEQFVLVSDATDEIVRRAAVRLDDVYAAFARYMPPRAGAQGVQGGTVTTILLAGSTREYQAILRSRNHFVLNAALYDPSRNQILCASDLDEMGGHLREARLVHREQFAELARRERQALTFPRGELRDKLLRECAGGRHGIRLQNEQNEKAFTRAARRLFQTLYHEAFHAYLANFVYPPAECEVPRWLNEGLAQIFETAIVEAGELRVGHADPARLGQVKDLARQHKLVPLVDLLRAGSREFLVGHADDRMASDRSYATSWAVASYLTFELRLLGTPALDRYVHDLKRGVEPVEAFRGLVGKPVPEFEAGFHRYLLGLQADGTVRNR